MFHTLHGQDKSGSAKLLREPALQRLEYPPTGQFFAIASGCCLRPVVSEPRTLGPSSVSSTPPLANPLLSSPRILNLLDHVQLSLFLGRVGLAHAVNGGASPSLPIALRCLLDVARARRRDRQK